MNTPFQPIQLLQNACDQGKTGHLKITANQVTWDFYFVEGMLEDATHSLQSLTTLQHYLLLHNQTAIAKVLPSLAKNVPANHPLIPTIFKQLKEQQYLTGDDWFMVTTDLIKDALESYLWLKQAHHHWQDQQQDQSSHRITINENHLLTVSTLLDTFVVRMKAWRILSPTITSPHQRLICPNPSLIEQKVPSGTLNPTTLGRLVKVMEGKTLRQISLFLKQDELKVAQLLLPYVKNKILELQPPQPPFDKLPLISPVTPTSQPSPQQVTPKPSFKSHHPSPQKKEQKIHKIVCIDDSQSILDMIKAYLEGDQFEVFTVDNPTQSLPCLFKCKPDLILIDFSMPGINGNKLCRIIKGSSLFKDTPIIMISGNEKMLTPENIQQAGATDYLAKPFSKEILLNIIDKYLSTNTKVNQQPNQPIANSNYPSISTEKAEFEPSGGSTRKTIKITQTDDDIDPLTQLPNRQCFEQYLSLVIKNADKRKSPFSLMFITIDNFADIQATLGDNEGDKILQNIAKQIQAFIRANDVVGSWSNNEFVILLNNVIHPKTLEKISGRILKTIPKDPLILQHKLTLQLSHTIKIHSLEKVG